MSSFPQGSPVTITAVVENAEGVVVPDVLTWTTTAGTLTTDATGLVSTVVDAPIGDVTVTASDSIGVTGSVVFTVVDATPASITLTAS